MNLAVIIVFQWVQFIKHNRAGILPTPQAILGPPMMCNIPPTTTCHMNLAPAMVAYQYCSFKLNEILLPEISDVW